MKSKLAGICAVVATAEKFTQRDGMLMTTKAEELARAHTKLITQAKSQPGVADILRTYQIQADFLRVYAVAARAESTVQYGRMVKPNAQ